MLFDRSLLARLACRCQPLPFSRAAPYSPQPMIGLLQRVSEASVRVAGEEVGAIGPGLLVLVAVERGDGPEQVRRLAERLVAYRVFADASG